MSLSAAIRFVLVGTQHPGNMGSAARAMRTMGFTRMVLVAPEKAPNHETDAMAAGAESLVREAPVFASLAEAVADCGLVLGCTARSRRVALEELAPPLAAERALSAAAKGREVALVFGRERTGLTNEELQLCHAAIHIPSDPDFSSLNLAAAVQVIAYAVRMGQLMHGTGVVGTSIQDAENDTDPPASHQDLEGFFGQLDATLHAIDFHKGRAPESAMRKLRRIFLRNALSIKEVRLLRGVLADAQRMAMLAGKQV